MSHDTFYDPEATVQEADIMMTEYADEEHAIAGARDAGLCVHAQTVGRSVSGMPISEQVGLKAGQYRCIDVCGRTFACADDLHDSTMAAIWNHELI
jgi:hypothetical protein